MLAGQVIVGASLSSTVMLKEQEAVLPAPSVATYVCVVFPNGKTEPLGSPCVSTTLDIVQLSAPAGVVKDTTSEHTTLIFAGQVMVGRVVSSTVTVNEQVAELPAASVARYVTVFSPTGKDDPLASPAIRMMLRMGVVLLAVGMLYVTTFEQAELGTTPATMSAGQLITTINASDGSSENGKLPKPVSAASTLGAQPTQVTAKAKRKARIKTDELLMSEWYELVSYHKCGHPPPDAQQQCREPGNCRREQGNISTNPKSL